MIKDFFLEHSMQKCYVCIYNEEFVIRTVFKNYIMIGGGGGYFFCPHSSQDIEMKKILKILFIFLPIFFLFPPLFPFPFFSILTPFLRQILVIEFHRTNLWQECPPPCIRLRSKFTLKAKMWTNLFQFWLVKNHFLSFISYLTVFYKYSTFIHTQYSLSLILEAIHANI